MARRGRKRGMKPLPAPPLEDKQEEPLNTPPPNSPSPNTPPSISPLPNAPPSNSPSPNTPPSNSPSPNTPPSNSPSPNTPAPTEEQLPVAPPTTPSGNLKRKGRGPTCGFALKKYVKIYGKIRLNISTNGSILCEFGNYFASACGKIVRSFCPLQVENWRSIPWEDRRLLFDLLLDYFILDLELTHVLKCCNNNMATKFRNFRCKIHNHFKTFKTADLAREEPYQGINQQDWDWLCSYFSRNNVQQRSAINSVNRSKMLYTHRGGSKTFVRHREEQRNKETNEELSEIELFRCTHWSAKNGWISELASKQYNQMTEMRENTLLDGTNFSDAQICETVLGKCLKYTKGNGCDNRPIIKLGAQMDSAQLHETREQLAKNQEELAGAKIEIERQKELIQTMHEKQQKFEEMLQFLMAGTTSQNTQPLACSWPQKRRRRCAGEPESSQLNNTTALNSGFLDRLCHSRSCCPQECHPSAFDSPAFDPPALVERPPKAKSGWYV